jgi:hypothetical protein
LSDALIYFQKCNIVGIFLVKYGFTKKKEERKTKMEEKIINE